MKISMPSQYICHEAKTVLVRPVHLMITQVSTSSIAQKALCLSAQKVPFLRLQPGKDSPSVNGSPMSYQWTPQSPSYMSQSFSIKRCEFWQ